MNPVYVHTEHPFGKGPLTAGGVQWSAAVSSVLGTYKTVEAVTIRPPKPGPGALIEVELSVTWQQKSDGATEKPIGKVQARNNGGTWVDLMTPQESASAGTTYEEFTFAGKFALVANFNALPFEVQVLVKSNAATPAENAVGQVKNSSYVTVIYPTS